MNASPVPNRIAPIYWWFAVGVMVFTVYGSLVPFAYHNLPLSDATAKFQSILGARLGIDSRSDFLANGLLGLPLGFFLLAALRADRRPNPGETAWTGIAVWPLCVFFAASVEFSQLWFPGRTCSLSDIVAQSIGSAIGMFLWTMIGSTLTETLRGGRHGATWQSTAGRLTMTYLGVLVIAQLMPFDISVSGSDLARNVRNATVIPFDELNRADVVEPWSKVQSWLEVAGLYFIGGVLLGSIPRTNAKRRIPLGVIVLLCGLILGVLIETAQLTIQTRSPSVTDALIGGCSLWFGWALVQLTIQQAQGNGIELEAALIYGQAWGLLLILIHWNPFQFDMAIALARWQIIEWIPFANASERNYLFSLEQAIVKTILFAIFGVLVVAVGPLSDATKRLRLFAGAIITGLIACMLEFGQLLLPTRFVEPTDILLALFGGWVGGYAAWNIRRDARMESSSHRTLLPTTGLPRFIHDDPIRVRIEGGRGAH